MKKTINPEKIMMNFLHHFAKKLYDLTPLDLELAKVHKMIREVDILGGMDGTGEQNMLYIERDRLFDALCVQERRLI